MRCLLSIPLISILSDLLHIIIVYTIHGFTQIIENACLGGCRSIERNMLSKITKAQVQKRKGREFLRHFRLVLQPTVHFYIWTNSIQPIDELGTHGLNKKRLFAAFFFFTITSVFLIVQRRKILQQ